MELLYEYAVVRVVPKVEREEFVNAGIILFCKKTGYLDCKFSVSENELKCFDLNVDLEQIRRNLEAFERIARGKDANSTISKLPAPERFRWLTATRSTIIQCSKVHPGFAQNESSALDHLMQRFFAEE